MMFDYYYSAAPLSDWVRLLKVGLSSAEQSGEPAPRCHMLNHLGVAYSRIGHNDDAVESFRHALDLFPQIDDDNLRSSVLGNLGSTLREIGRYPEGLVYAGQALQIAEATGNRYYEAGALDALCELHVALGNNESALHFGERGLAAARETRQILMEANLVVNIAHAQRGLDHVGEAKAGYAEGLRLCQSAGDRYHEAQALFGLAELHRRTSQDQLATENAERALAIFVSLDAEEADVVRIFIAAVNRTEMTSTS
jgi:tetratricopeptide (TPR) repeat protein